MCTAACHGARDGRWIVTTMKLMESMCNFGLPLEVASLQFTPELQNCYIRQILPVQFFLGGDVDTASYSVTFQESLFYKIKESLLFLEIILFILYLRTIKNFPVDFGKFINSFYLHLLNILDKC
ncbi:hypothetical protein HJG60_011221 [Phyllostomus discolor]|uniref:Uncharacterized protein n=1 Tax=Phyllostomus discolor TaxID=89673 RepID=A0A834A298_9CHIR|nr:hypothetical protein HJG60_011221 [Phyllostomus discolor]